MKKTPVKGTRDYLPQETYLRDNIQKSIIDTYKNNGFERITTPIVEDIDNLINSEGGENLKLIFKILKRGDKLNKASSPEDMADLGLRYDLTLPLSRYYANNKANLKMPFKCIQIDRVYRAEQPQKGRMREFNQCDIDIIGSSSINCETELIMVTAAAVEKLGIGEFEIIISDRRILKSFLLSCGFLVESLDTVCITLDKLDKLGIEGIADELIKKDISPSAVNLLKSRLENLDISELDKYCGDTDAAAELREIIKSVERLSMGRFKLIFDISLVRGQGYYTGTIFEIRSKKYSSSVGGGGRYDNLIGKFTGENIPAVGFSIGFERIFDILSEEKYSISQGKPRVALFYSTDCFEEAYLQAEKLRENYDVLLVQRPKKLGKALAQYEKDNFDGYLVNGESDEVKFFSASASGSSVQK